MFINNLTVFSRRKNNEVKIGDIPLGAKNPVRIQSMTNTNIKDTEATISQIIKIKNEGADYVRLAIPSINDVNYLKQIKEALGKRGFYVPLIADVHFNPAIAEKAAKIVEKVRINPGNFSNENELKNKFVHLITICKKNNTTLRIGVNHGSLAERIKNKYGDTPEGMVESAMEFLRICKKEDFNKVVISMKASNTRIMVYSTRLLVEHMNSEDMHYPLHLGVTEAGEGEDGRIKSAVGIGALLADGIGDTIRVSLTESPEREIPVAMKLAGFYKGMEKHQDIELPGEWKINFYSYEKRKTYPVEKIGGKNPPIVIADIAGGKDLSNIGFHLHNRVF